MRNVSNVLYAGAPATVPARGMADARAQAKRDQEVGVMMVRQAEGKSQGTWKVNSLSSMRGGVQSIPVSR
jgi:hypothetical protein